VGRIHGLSDTAQPKREILPIPDVPAVGLTTYDRTITSSTPST
jgi:hypothetical protein